MIEGATGRWRQKDEGDSSVDAWLEKKCRKLKKSWVVLEIIKFIAYSIIFI